MKDVKKVMCFCVCGIGTSLMMEMAVKDALKNLGREDIEVEHSTVDDIYEGAADLFICGESLVERAQSCGPTIGLINMASVEEAQEKIGEFLNS